MDKDMKSILPNSTLGLYGVAQMICGGLVLIYAAYVFATHGDPHAFRIGEQNNPLIIAIIGGGVIATGLIKRVVFK